MSTIDYDSFGDDDNTVLCVSYEVVSLICFRNSISIEMNDSFFFTW